MNKIIVGVLIVVTITVFTLILRSTPLFDELDQKLSNNLYKTGDVSEEIVIVSVDEASMDKVENGGLGAFGSWSKDYFASVLENVRDGGSNSILMDFTFADKTKTVTVYELADQLLQSKDFGEFGENVAQYLDGENPQDAALAGQLLDDVFMIKYPTSNPVLIGNILSVNGEEGSLDYFTKNAHTAFATSGSENSSASVYSIPIGYLVNEKFEESVSLQIARHYLYRDLAGGDFENNNEIYAFDDLREIPVENGEMLINYVAKPYSFKTYSFADIYYGHVNPSVFDGKIVLIGATAPILHDRYYTPIDQQTQMPGVEIQANAIQNILDGNFLAHQNTGSFVLLVTLMVAFVVGISLCAHAVVGASALLSMLVLLPIYARWSFDSGVIPNLIWPVLAVLAAYISALIYRNFTEFNEKRKLKNAFTHYVSPELVQQIVERPELLTLGGEKRNLSVMFLDIENFTGMTESCEPAKIVSLINTYFDALAKVIIEHGGMVDKFEGDSIMALFGVPLASQDHGVRACQTALALQNKVTEVNRATGEKLAIRIGVATGDAIVGNMGSFDRFDYTAMGDTVNTASRLEGGNKFYGTQILVNSHTVNVAQKVMTFRRVDRVKFKGKGEATDVFELVGPTGKISDEDKAVIEVWHQALEYYRNQKWDDAQTRVRKVLSKMPKDGPALTYLKRIDELQKSPLEGWDGTWEFEEK